MTPEQAAQLREPFPPENVGKLPRVWCGDCRLNKLGKVCGKHHIARCDGCRNKITNAHLHLDYVGHAEVTDRLLRTDPVWSWEPFGITSDGLPAVDRNGGLWIRMTVCGVTRPGYGHAGEKSGGDAVKEAIGDAIRNAAMRFGVALDLWGASFKAEAEADHDADATTSEPAPRDVPAPEDFPQLPAESAVQTVLSATSTASEIRAAIKAAGTAKKLSITEIAEDFFEWTKGGQIGQASPEMLFEYLEHLTKPSAA